jgi:hypothetical protein
MFAFGLGNIIGIQAEVAREECRIRVMANNANIRKMLAEHSTGSITSGEYLGAYLFEMGLVSGWRDTPYLLAQCMHGP